MGQFITHLVCLELEMGLHIKRHAVNLNVNLKFMEFRLCKFNIYKTITALQNTLHLDIRHIN